MHGGSGGGGGLKGPPPPRGFILLVSIWKFPAVLDPNQGRIYRNSSKGGGGGGSGPEFFKGGGGLRVQVRRNFHILTSKQKTSGGGGLAVKYDMQNCSPNNLKP